MNLQERPIHERTSILPLHVAGLGFEAEGKPLLQGISFAIPKGGITAIIGPNGAGKSLLLRLCHGLLVPSSGSVVWGVPLNESFGRKNDASKKQHATKKQHAMVFQRPVMLRRSVRANLAHALAAIGSDHSEARINAALQRFGLEALADNPARLLSGGEQQRLALARAWSLEPEVLFLDEPSSQLDPGATRQIEQIIKGLAKEGMTIVMSTHDLGQARRLSQRVLFLHHGKLVEDADTKVFFDAPATPEALAFTAGDLLW
jgi:tungstate transport system ATP-binding protein